MKKTNILNFAVMIFLFSAHLDVWGQTPPGLMNFQGRLTDAANNPLTGPQNFTFRIYDASAGGTQLWTETQAGITVTNGVLSVQLGAAVPLTADNFNGAAAYLEITVGGVTLSPRQRLVTSAYAFNAHRLEGRSYAAFVTTDAAAGYADGSAVGAATATLRTELNTLALSTGPLVNYANWNTAFGWGDHASAGYTNGSALGLATGTLRTDLNAVALSTGPLVNYANWNTAYGWGNHATAGYTDGSAIGVATATLRTDLNAVALSTGPLVNYTNWNTAYGWGNHALAGYTDGSAIGAATATLRTDLNAVALSTGPLVNYANWNTAYGWGNHALAGYTDGSAIGAATATLRTDLNAVALSTGPLVNYANWNTAYGWGNHALAGYTDGSAIGVATATLRTDLNAVALSTGPLVNYPNWNTAYGWGNHATAGYAKFDSSQTFTGANTFTSTTAFTAQNASMAGVTISSGLIVSMGNVGIGTTAPEAKLEVKGGSILVSNAPTYGVVNPAGLLNVSNDVSGAATINFMDQENSANFLNVNIAKFTGAGYNLGGYPEPSTPGNSRIGSFNFRVADGSQLLTASAIGGDIDGIRSANSIFGRLTFSTNNGSAAPTEKMRITSEGNVGIGTAGPAAKLDVAGSAQFGSGAAKSTFTATGALDMASGSSITLAGGGRLTGVPSPSADSDAANKAYVDNLTGSGSPVAVLAATQTFTGQNAFQNQVTVSSNLFVTSGNVGIGTTTPGAKLDVQGTTNDGNSLVTLAQSGTGRGLYVIRNVPSATRVLANFAQLSAAAGTDPVLHVQQAATTEKALAVSNDGSIYNFFVTGVGNMYAAGDVGIGTTNPTAQLHVVGVSSFTDKVYIPENKLYISSGAVGQVLKKNAGGWLEWGYVGVPTGTITFFDLPGCPSGWTEVTSAQGRYLVGLPSGGTLGGMAGTALSNIEDRQTGQHNHGVTDPGHVHDLLGDASGGDVVVGADNGAATHNGSYAGNVASHVTGITINNSGAIAGTNAPYIQYRACKCIDSAACSSASGGGGSTQLAVNLAGGAAGAVVYQSGESNTTFLNIGANNTVLTSNGSVPTWNNAPALSGANFTGVADGALSNNVALLTGAQAFTGAKTFSAAASFPGSGIWNASGDVGIGTATPGYKTHIYQDQASQAASTPVVYVEAGGTAAATKGSILELYSTRGSGTVDVDLFKVRTSEGTKFTIRNDGNVGISTSAPAYKLDVNGDVNISAGSVYRIDGVAQSGASKWTAGSGDDIYRSLGNVGIGTTGPGARLDVRGTGTQAYSLAVGTSTAYSLVVSTSGYVGIGTTEPTAKLHVGADTNGRAMANIAATFENSYLVLGRTGDSATIVNKNDGTLRINHSGSSTDAHLVILNTGNVGIGTTNPASSLEVQGTGITLGGVTRTTWPSGSGTGFGTDAGTYAYYTGGNVGIGTTSPGAALDVSNGSETGSIRIGGDVNAFTRTNVTRKIGRLSGAHYTNAEAPVAIALLDADSTVSLLGIGGGGNALNAVTGLTFFTAANTTTRTGTARMTINSDGNVGIGTTTPTVALDVAGALRTTNSSTPSSGAGLEISYAPGFNGGTSQLTSYDRTGGVYKNFIINASSQEFRISGGPAMNIVPGGDVGIGTTNPTLGKLQVDGGAAAVKLAIKTTNPGASVATLRLENSAGAFNDVSEITHGGGVTEFRNGTPTTVMALDMTNARVGIGMTNPGYKLEVAGAINAQEVRVNGVVLNPGTGSNWTVNVGDIYRLNGNVGIGMTNPGSPLHVLGTPNAQGGGFNGYAQIGQMQIGTTGVSPSTPAFAPNSSGQAMAFGTFVAGTYTERVRIANTGNVGIGTTNPDYKLQVVANADGVGLRINNTATRYRSDFARSATDLSINAYDDTGAVYQPIQFDASYHRFSISGSEKVRIDSSGNVGIGTTAPDSALTVHRPGGTAQIEVKGGGDTWNYSGFNLWSDEATDKYWSFMHRKAGGEANNLLLEEFDGTTYKQRMVMKPDGTVNFGNSTTKTQFELQGAGDAYNYTNMVFWNNDWTRYWALMHRKDAGDVNKLFFEEYNGSAYNIRMTLSPGGNVGIGTTEPGAKLHAVETSGSNSYVFVASTATDPGSYKLVVSTSGNVGVGTTAPTAKLQIRQSSDDIYGGVSVLSQDGSSRAIWVGARNDTTARIESGVGGTGNLILNSGGGNVGIGTATPSAPLTVSGANAPWRGQLMVRDTTLGNNADAYMSFWSDSETGSGNTGLLGYVGYVSDADNNMSVGNYMAGAAGPLLLNQWGGNVGIGTTAPRAPLDVAGPVLIRNNTGGYAQSITKVQGASGPFTHLRITAALGGAGGYTYRVQVGGTGGSQFQTGGGYTNGTGNFSHAISSGAGFTASTPSNDVLQLDIDVSHTHPVCIFEIVGSLNQTSSASDITITFS